MSNPILALFFLTKTTFCIASRANLIITNVCRLTNPAHFRSPSCLCEFWQLKSDNSNRKTHVRFVYVLPHILHGDFFYEIKYLVNPQLNILHILIRNVIFFYDYYQEYVAPFNSNFHNKTLCESGVMWITRFVTYLSIAFHIYLLIIIHFCLTQSVYVKICIGMDRGSNFKFAKYLW
jgi:hypothetical protein